MEDVQISYEKMAQELNTIEFSAEKVVQLEKELKKLKPELYDKEGNIKEEEWKNILG